MEPAKRLLFITNAELGQANVHLAVLEELLSTNRDLELHVCSFGSLSQPVASLGGASSSGNGIVFHELKGPTWKDTLFHRPEHHWSEVASLQPSCWNAKRAAPMMPRIVAPWSNEELSDLVLQVDKVVRDADAHLVVVDNLLTPAITVCYELGVKWCILSPNTYREFILAKQPIYDQLFVHPPFVYAPFSMQLDVSDRLLTFSELMLSSRIEPRPSSRIRFRFICISQPGTPYANT